MVSGAGLFGAGVMLVTNRASLLMHTICAAGYFGLSLFYIGWYFKWMLHDVRCGILLCTRLNMCLLCAKGICVIIAVPFGSIYVLCLFLKAIHMTDGWIIHLGLISFNFTFFEWGAYLVTPLFFLLVSLRPALVTPPHTLNMPLFTGNEGVDLPVSFRGDASASDRMMGQMT